MLRLILHVISSLANADGGQTRAAALAGSPANRAVEGVSVLDKGLRREGGSRNGQTGEIQKKHTRSRFAAEPSSFSGIVGGGNLLCRC